MSLEPTGEQIERIKDEHHALDSHDATGLWRLIRDMVLEEAALACERNALNWPPFDGGRRVFAMCANDIRAMKGKP